MYTVNFCMSKDFSWDGHWYFVAQVLPELCLSKGSKFQDINNIGRIFLQCCTKGSVQTTKTTGKSCVLEFRITKAIKQHDMADFGPSCTRTLQLSKLRVES